MTRPACTATGCGPRSTSHDRALPRSAGSERQRAEGVRMTMFQRSGQEYVARFTPQEAQVLRQCMAELAELISNDPDPDDPAVERLFPDVYPEDPTEQAEFRRFTEADLKSAKLDQAKTVLTDLLEGGGEVRLAEEKADLWLRALTDIRLTLGTRLGV